MQLQLQGMIAYIDRQIGRQNNIQIIVRTDYHVDIVRFCLLIVQRVMQQRGR